MGLMDQYHFHDPQYQDPAMDHVWLALMTRPMRHRTARAPQTPSVPRQSMPRHAHRCGHPWLHLLLILIVCGAWLIWSVPFTLHVGPWLARRLFAPDNPLQLIPIALTWIPWLVGVIPAVVGLLWGMTLGTCGRVPYVPAPPQHQAPMGSGQPVMIERIMLTPEDAARLGLPGPVIAERIHFERGH